MTRPGRVAIWSGYVVALSGASALLVAGMGVQVPGLDQRPTTALGAGLLMAGLGLIAGGITAESRRRDRTDGVALAAAVIGAESRPGVGVAYLPDLEELERDPTPQASIAWSGLQSVLEGELREFQLEYPVRDDGTTRWYLMRLHPFPEGTDPARVTGEPDEDHILLTREEITARVEAQRALEEGRPQLRSILSPADDLIFALDTAGALICAYGRSLPIVQHEPGPEVEHEPGQTFSEVAGRSPAEVFGEEAGQTLAALSGRVLRGEHLQADLILTGADGRRQLRTSFAPLRGAKGTIIGIVGVGRDVTTEARIEAARRRSDLIRETVGFASNHFLRSTDWASSIREVLERFAEVTGSSRVELRERLGDADGRPVLRLLQEWTQPDLAGRSGPLRTGALASGDPGLEQAFEALSAGEPALIAADDLPDSERGLPNGHEVGPLLLIPIILGKSWSGTLGFNSSGDRDWSAEELEALHGAAEVFAAALDRIRTADALRESEVQLQHAQKMEAVGRLAGGIAHDFNNLLTAIKGRTELLLSEDQISDYIEGDLLEIQAAALRAATLTRQLLAFSRRQVLEPRVLDLNQIVRVMELMLRRLIGENVILLTRLAPDLGSIQADPSHLEQVLMNLVVNARDAMPEGGAITIETANIDLDSCAARLEGLDAAGHYVMLRVTDTGNGIPAELHERVFEPFFTTKEQGKGTGLGLSMAWGIVKQSGGHISLQSEVGKGTSFRILFPRGPSYTPNVEPVVEVTTAEMGSETILLVEDEAAVRSLVRKVLERKGYTVLETTNGAEAIQLADSFTGEIDLILTDVVMPDITGPQLVATLAPRLGRARILFMSGYTDQEIIRHGVGEFNAGFIAKPFSPNELAAKVRSVLDAEHSLT